MKKQMKVKKKKNSSGAYILRKLLREEKAGVKRGWPFTVGWRLSLASLKFKDTMKVVWHSIKMLLDLSLDTKMQVSCHFYLSKLVETGAMMSVL